MPVGTTQQFLFPLVYSQPEQGSFAPVLTGADFFVGKKPSTPEAKAVLHRALSLCGRDRMGRQRPRRHRSRLLRPHIVARPLDDPMMWLFLVHSVCFAIFLELADRASELPWHD